MIYNSYDNIGLKKVLSFLKSHKTEYLSGQDLSDILKISRVAVWKHIKKIRTLGYNIESKQKLGYKLSGNTTLLLPWEITEGLKTKFIGKRVYYFDTIDSTQNFALKKALDSKENGSVIVSEKQTKGRGRLGRQWVSPPGGIWLSIIFHPEFNISLSTLFPLTASLALCIAIEKTLGLKPELKWPNDVTLNGKKAAGMLVDASMEFSKIENLVLGVGINYNVSPLKIGKALKKTENFYGVASLSTNSKEKKPIALVQSFLYELEKLYYCLEKGKTKSIIEQWTKRSSTIGKIITVAKNNDKIKGLAVKIDSEGALLISTKSRIEKVLAGDVIHPG